MKRRLFLLVALMLLAILLFSFLFLRTTLAASSVPQTTYTVAGLSGQVLIRYDASGTPHIQANGEQDGYTGFCWAEAHDRLFQLDFLRRVGEGRLAEILGAGPNNSILQQDELYRTLGLTQLAATHFAAATATTQANLTACARGINAFMSWAETHQALPLEFSDLGYQPDAWQPQDGLVIAEFVASTFDNGIFLEKLERAAVTATAGAQGANALIPDPPDSPSMFDSGGHLNPLNTFIASANQSNTPAVTEVTNPIVDPSPQLAAAWQQLAVTSNWTEALLGGNRASNDIAVDGAVTASGKPLIANDPHLTLATPSLLYFVQLTVTGTNGFNVEGVSIPGFPVFLSGHTTCISWAITFGLIDDVDVYSETTRQTSTGEQVLFDGQWVPVQSRQEVIQVAGSASVTLQVLATPHGPVINVAMPELSAFGTLALKATDAQPGWTIDGWFSLPKARSWQQFHSALNAESIGLNFLFADNYGGRGHVAYQMAGLAPQRDMENTLFPVDGSDGNHEWKGYAAFSQLPDVYDPPGHILVTANNRIVPATYAPGGTSVYLSRYFDTSWRAGRAISLVLNAGHPLTAGDLEHIQLDTQTVVGQPIAADLVAALQRAGLPANDPSAAASLAALEAWDGNASVESRGATIYEALSAVLDRDVVTEALGSGSFQPYTQAAFITTQTQALRALLEAPRAPFFGVTNNAEAPSARDQAVQVALGETDALLRQALGANQSAWTWGALHTLTYNHPLATIDARFALLTFPTAGDGETVNTGGFFTQIGLLGLPPDQFVQAGGVQAAFAQDGLATARVIWNMASFDQSLGVLDTGESGDPTSPHWSDQATLWRAGAYHPMPFSEIAIEQADSQEVLLT